jgi:hypothetical protein
MLRTLRVLTLLCLGCGAAQAPKNQPLAVDPSRPLPAIEPAPPTDRLAPEASFAELVRSAGQLDGRARPPGMCLLSRTSSGFQLGGEVVAAVRPLPPAPEELDEALKSVERVELLGAWGRHGDGNGKLALVGFTASAPARSAVALILTDRGLSLRGASGTAVSPRDALDRNAALAALGALSTGESAPTIFVSAEAAIALRDVYALLEVLTLRGLEVVLSVSLATNTTLPLPASATALVARCEDGLSATDAPEGSLSSSEIMAGIAPLKERTPDCLLRGDARGAAGGRLSIAFRVAANGRVQEACISQDELGDPGVAACVIDIARTLSFAPPSAGGVLDLELPIALRASSRAIQRAACASNGTP